MKYKVILWDFDGTLANTGADVWDSLEYAAGKLGGSLEEARVCGVRNYIITLKPEEALLRILKKKGWTDLFEGCFSPDSFGEVIRSKAQVIEDVMASGQMERESVVYIGDTYSDVTAAHENHIHCIGVTYGDGDTNKLLETGPDELAANGEELKKRLEQEDNR